MYEGRYGSRLFLSIPWMAMQGRRVNCCKRSISFRSASDTLSWTNNRDSRRSIWPWSRRRRWLKDFSMSMTFSNSQCELFLLVVTSFCRSVSWIRLGSDFDSLEGETLIFICVWTVDSGEILGFGEIFGFGDSTAAKVDIIGRLDEETVTETTEGTVMVVGVIDAVETTAVVEWFSETLSILAIIQESANKKSLPPTWLKCHVTIKLTHLRAWPHPTNVKPYLYKYKYINII